MTEMREVRTRDDADVLLRDFHDARRREDQWRIPQLLLALVTPIMALIAVVFDVMGTGDPRIAGALAIVTGLAAALLSVQVWRWHRIAIDRLNQFRTEYGAESALLLKDPI
jgi:protein-S-isoprenylcysteine O-methyltransferase Ste14